MKPFDWLPDQGWEDIMKLATTHTDTFGSLADDIEKDKKSWKKVFLKEQVQKMLFILVCMVCLCL